MNKKIIAVLLMGLLLPHSSQAACNVDKLLSDMNNCLTYKKAYEIKECILEGLGQGQGSCMPANVKGCSCKSTQGKDCNIEKFAMDINKCLVPRDSESIKHCILVAFAQGEKFTHEGSCLPSNVSECSCK